MADLVDDLFALPETFSGMDTMPSPFVYLMGCGNFNQFCCTLRGLIDPGEYCPFCSAELRRRERFPLKVMGGWQLLENEFPNSNVARMLLITPTYHQTNPGKLTGHDWGHIGRLFQYCQSDLGIESGGLALRFGDPHLHAGTIAHLHFNIIEPICGKEFRVPLAKNVEDHAKNYERLITFRNILKERGGSTWLFSSQGIAETQPVM